MIKGTVYYTDHFVNNTVTQFFAKALDLKLENIKNYEFSSNDTFITYGILRGTGKIIKESQNYIYIDHGFMNSSDRMFNKSKMTLINNLDGYFRVIRNDLYFNKSNDLLDKSRFDYHKNWSDRMDTRFSSEEFKSNYDKVQKEPVSTVVDEWNLTLLTDYIY